MTLGAIILVAFVYVAVAADRTFHEDFGMAFAFLCYALANFGLYAAAK